MGYFRQELVNEPSPSILPIIDFCWGTSKCADLDGGRQGNIAAKRIKGHSCFVQVSILFDFTGVLCCDLDTPGVVV